MSTYWKANQRRLAPWLFLAPGLLMFAVYVIIPIFQSMWISFYDWDGLGEKVWIGTANYVEMTTDPNMRTSFVNNIIWLALYLLAVPAGLFIAIFLNQTVGGIRLYKSLFFFPFVISQVVVGLIFSWFYAPGFGLFYNVIEWVRLSELRVLVVSALVYSAAIAMILALTALTYWLYLRLAAERSRMISGIVLVLVWCALGQLVGFANPFGWVRALLTVLAADPALIVTWPVLLWQAVSTGILGNGKGIAILADPELVTYGIIIAGLWPQIAYVMILYLTGLNNVAPDQVEAARLDGAKGWKMLYYVILPQLRPATFIAVVVTVIGALRSFDLVSIMTSGGPFGSSRVLSYYMYETALSEYGYRMGYGAAIAVVLFAIMMVFISGFIWKMWRDETER